MTDGKEFVDADLSGARFVRSDLSSAVMRGVQLNGADIEAPWLLESGNSLHINGIDVVPYVDAELNRRFPGRAERRAETPDGLRAAWAALETAWATVLERVEGMPVGTVDISVDGEWSFAQTLRHLVMAIDTWLGRAILEQPDPYHPIGQPNIEFASDGGDMSIFSAHAPTYRDVLDVFAVRQAMVHAYLTSLGDADLLGQRRNPWDPDYPETVLSCLHTILEEEWEHLRYAVRDLDVIDARR